MIRAACRSVIFAFGQATRRTQEHPGLANNKPKVVEAAEAAATAAFGGRLPHLLAPHVFLVNASLASAGLFLCRRTRMRRFIPDTVG
jgi:hypothetical protein